MILFELKSLAFLSTVIAYKKPNAKKAIATRAIDFKKLPGRIKFCI